MLCISAWRQDKWRRLYSQFLQVIASFMITSNKDGENRCDCLTRVVFMEWIHSLIFFLNCNLTKIVFISHCLLLMRYWGLGVCLTWKSPQHNKRSIFMFSTLSISCSVAYIISSSPWAHPSIAIWNHIHVRHDNNIAFLCVLITFISAPRVSAVPYNRTDLRHVNSCRPVPFRPVSNPFFFPFPFPERLSARFSWGF